MSAIDEIKQRLDIVDVVSDYVTLKKSGRNFKALCPFHSEKTPSFFVFPERASWRCFGSCGSGGDIFSFVMKKEGIDFGEALRLLADRAGVTLTPKGKERAEDKQLERLCQINEAAAHYYHHLLLNAKAAETARSHLRGRGVSPETIESFQLGFSPDSWDAL
ncbi:MAG: CHC2 zinc finger domain-containing protein, partial [Dehalococcoidia bacterium]